MGSGEGRPTRQGSLWHESFYECITDRAPPGFEVRSEIPLSLRPRRADLLLLRRRDVPRRDDQARILRGLWARLPRATLVELKSPTRGLRRAELLRLLGYGLQYHEGTWRELAHRSELALVLVVAARNQALADDLAAVDCHLRPLGNGYAEMIGFLYTTYVVFTDEVAEAEQDDFLRIFSHHAVQTPEAFHWLEHWIVEKQAMPNVTEREGYDEMLEKLVRSHPPEKILRLYAPEQRLAGLAPEQRLAGLSREQQILALPDELLRGLSEDYIRSLPQDVQQVIRKRLAQGT
jgi:hypothetical protein